MGGLFLAWLNKNKASEPSRDQIKSVDKGVGSMLKIIFKCFLMYLTFQEERLH